MSVREGSNPNSLRGHLWSAQTTSNSVLGVKIGFYQPYIDAFFDTFSGGKQGLNRRAIWETVFPRCQHIVMMRRDKVRLAVSWWKAICGGPYHMSQDGQALPWEEAPRQEAPRQEPTDLEERYDFESIKGLMRECEVREAGIKQLLEELQVVPLKVVYEDFTDDYETTVKTALTHIGLDASEIDIPTPILGITSNHVDDQWASRFESDLRVS